MKTRLDPSPGTHIILFDGVCNLCNSTVQTVIKRDRKKIFRFAPLQSEVGKQLLLERGMDPEELDSVILVIPGHAYYKRSTAALEIARHLDGFKWLRIFKYLPEGFRDLLYEIVAKNRYKWFGKKNNCMIPTPEVKNLFLE